MFQGDAPDTELLHVLAERDQLKAALLGLEKRLEDTQDTVKALVTERDHLKKLLKVSPLQNSRATILPRLSETVLHRCVSLSQAHEDLRLKNTTDMSADLKQAEMTIQQMSIEIEVLKEKVKVGFQPGILK